jgi:hypothetical protein
VNRGKIPHIRDMTYNFIMLFYDNFTVEDEIIYFSREQYVLDRYVNQFFDISHQYFLGILLTHFFFI